MTPSRFAADGLIFDLDGTLVDSVPDICAAANRVLLQLGLDSVPEARLRKWVGNGLAKLLKRALTGEMDGEPDAALFERALPMVFDSYYEHVFELSRLYPGVAETLDHFHRNGFRLACVTNKPARHTALLLKQAGLQQLFDSVVGGDTLPQNKPDPQPLLHACQGMSLEPGQCLMIGDSLSDVRAARAAAIPVLCLTYGYNQGIDPATMEPDALVDSFGDLVSLIGKKLPTSSV